MVDKKESLLRMRINAIREQLNKAIADLNEHLAERDGYEIELEVVWSPDDEPEDRRAA